MIDEPDRPLDTHYCESCGMLFDEEMGTCHVPHNEYATKRMYYAYRTRKLFVWDTKNGLRINIKDKPVRRDLHDLCRIMGINLKEPS